MMNVRVWHWPHSGRWRRRVKSTRDLGSCEISKGSSMKIVLSMRAWKCHCFSSVHASKTLNYKSSTKKKKGEIFKRVQKKKETLIPQKL
ncbi:hypothetical protein CARUB_v10006853mg [Capsella rubella]|uniref:Uncharacterized protein n=1 Tax=Capsella rubella TaxID=81985 RepID=R0H143_9BRAS|nr:hypothetical protein CARUB_v10006853mg [Capsella rubella]